MGSEARSGWWSWFGACCVAAALGCGARAPECQGPRCEELDVHVLTWWPPTNNTPAAPLKEAAELQPGVGEVVLNHRFSKNAMMAAVESLLQHPDGSGRVDTFLANGGRDVLRWTPCGGEGSTERLLQLDGPGGYADLSSRFAPEVLTGVSCCPQVGCAQPGIYALPLGLHRVNHIVYNVARFASCDSKSVKDAASLVQLLHCLGDGGQRVISAPAGKCPVCSEGEESAACRDCRGVAGESLSYLLESLVLLVSDASAYQSYWRGQSWQSADAGARAEPLRQALSLLEGELSPFLNNCPMEPCAPETAEQALEQVRRGDAAFLVMPDWLMLEAQKTGDGALEGMPFPGTDDTFLFLTDVFSIPIAGTPGTSVEAGFRWLDALLDPQLQQRFAEQKHAKAALAGPEQRPLPSLEAQLPASIDPAHLRASLNQWLLDLEQGATRAVGLEQLMDHEFAEAQRHGTLRVGPCSNAPCGSR